jgi:cytoskeletal protein RodZ
MENKNRNLWIWIVVVFIIVVGVVLWATKSSAPIVVQNTTPADNTALQVQSTEDLSTGSVDATSATSPAATIAYSDALVKYAKARLQLDTTCQGSPDNMTFKNNALLMVDNRAPVARTVHIGSVFPIKAYGFKIIKLSSAKLPVTWKVDCDSSQNVSSILIEK